MNLEALPAQVIDCSGSIRLAPLGRRNEPRMRRTRAALVHGALVLQPVILQPDILVACRVLQREQERRLLDVGIVARTPIDAGRGRVRTIPLTALRAAATLDPALRAVGCDLVETTDRIVRVRNEEHVV